MGTCFKKNLFIADIVRKVFEKIYGGEFIHGETNDQIISRREGGSLDQFVSYGIISP